MIRHYLKIAVRNLLKYKTQNIISIIGLSVCLLCFSVCMYCCRFFLDINQSFENNDRIAEVVLQDEEGEFYSGTPASLLEQMKEVQIDEIEASTFITFSRHRSYNVEMEDGKERPFDSMRAIETDSNYYNIFTPKVIAGSWKVAAHTPNAVVMTASMARKAFGKEGNAIGKRMVLTQRLFSSPDSTPRAGGIVYTIQAVIEDIAQNNSLSFCKNIDLLVLNDSEGLLQSSARNSMTGGSTYALLRKGKDVKQLESRFRTMNLKHNLFNKDKALYATPLGLSFWKNSATPYFTYTTAALGILILLIGLLNFFHFLTGSFLNRSKEYSLRKVLGSDSRQLLSQLFVHSALVILLAFLFNFFFIELLSSYLHFSFIELTMSIDSALLMKQCSEYLIMIFAVNLLICALTVAYIRRISIQEGIKGTRYIGKHRLRNTMLGVQFFICWLFITLTVALFLQAEKTTSTLFSTLSKSEKECILSLSLDYRFMKNEEKLALIDRIGQHPGIQDRLLCETSYTDGVYTTGFQADKDNEASDLSANIMYITPNFFQFMNIPLLKGKTLTNESEMVIDEMLEKRFDKDLLGKTLYRYSDSYIVNGVSSPFVIDVYNRSEGFAFVPLEEQLGHCYLKCQPEQLDEVKAHVLNVLSEMLPHTLAPKLSTLQKDIEAKQAIEVKMKSIILFFAIVSIIITLLGVFSAITLDTEHRRKEVAIRKVNGAGLWQVFVLFIRSYAWILLVSAVIAFPLLHVLLRLWSQMYTVFFTDGWLFWGGIFITVTLILILTVIFRILKIARVNPAEVIKSE